ncbi:MAG: dockerin type I repeat-containing protein [Prevotellaceae bacterium]|nr:dockerin type I repeat-containing protein [Prevotellaceae bacterium]
MKKLICITLSICLLITCFSAVAFADTESPTTFAGEGFYVKSNGGLTISMKESDGDVAKEKMVDLAGNGDTYTPLYASSVKMDVTLTNAAAGNYLVILTSKTDGGMPTKSDEIYYIDQTTSNNGTVNFTVYPKDVDLEDNAKFLDMKMYITSSAEGFTMKTAELGYADGTFNVQEYKLGDSNGDGEINSKDATMILRYVVGDITAEDKFVIGVSNTNGDEEVNSKDATYILRYVVGELDDKFQEIK